MWIHHIFQLVGYTCSQYQVSNGKGVMSKLLSGLSLRLLLRESSTLVWVLLLIAVALLMDADTPFIFPSIFTFCLISSAENCRVHKLSRLHMSNTDC